MSRDSVVIVSAHQVTHAGVEQFSAQRADVASGIAEAELLPVDEPQLIVLGQDLVHAEISVNGSRLVRAGHEGVQGPPQFWIALDDAPDVQVAARRALQQFDVYGVASPGR